MTIKRRRVEGLLADSDEPLSPNPLNLGAKFATLKQIRARNWASAAKAGAGTDTAVKIKVSISTITPMISTRVFWSSSHSRQLRFFFAPFVGNVIIATPVKACPESGL